MPAVAADAPLTTQDHVPGPEPRATLAQLDDSDVGRLTRAVALAAEAGQWAVVELLGRQLEAMSRAAAPNVVDLASRRPAAKK